MSDLEVVCRELEEIGIVARPIRFDDFPPSPEGVVFEYPVPTGRFRAKRYSVALSFQENAYPEYAPHFVHILDLGHSSLTAYSKHDGPEGKKWWAFSAPPGDFWDRLPPTQKTMKTFVHRHLARLWAQL